MKSTAQRPASTSAIPPVPVLDPVQAKLKADAMAAVGAFREHVGGGQRRSFDRAKAISELKKANAAHTAALLTNVAVRRAGGETEDEEALKAAVKTAQAALDAIPEDNAEAVVAVTDLLWNRLLSVEAEINRQGARDRAAVFEWLSAVIVEMGRLASLAEEVGSMVGFEFKVGALPADPTTGHLTRLYYQDLPADVRALIDRLDEVKRIYGPVERTLSVVSPTRTSQKT